MFQITKLWSSLLNSNYTMKTLFLPRCLLDILSNSYLKIIYLAKSTDNFYKKGIIKVLEIFRGGRISDPLIIHIWESETLGVLFFKRLVLLPSSG